MLICLYVSIAEINSFSLRKPVFEEKIYHFNYHSMFVLKLTKIEFLFIYILTWNKIWIFFLKDYLSFCIYCNFTYTIVELMTQCIFYSHCHLYRQSCMLVLCDKFYRKKKLEHSHCSLIYISFIHHLNYIDPYFQRQLDHIKN